LSLFDSTSWQSAASIPLVMFGCLVLIALDGRRSTLEAEARPQASAGT
jgi:hypothetical protein